MSRIRAAFEQIDKMMKTATTPATSPIDPSLLAQCQEEVLNYKKDLATLYDELSAMDICDDDDLFTIHVTLERQLSAVAQKIKSLTVLPPTSTCTPSSTDTGVKLPKLDVPTFVGNLIHWKQFWDQFAVAIHNKTSLSNAEKTVYLHAAHHTGWIC